MIIPLETVDQGTFAPLTGQSFTTTTPDGASVALELSEARMLGHKRPEAARDPFSLTFVAAPGLRLPQGIYRFSCAALGELDLFITQLADGPQRAIFEAIFT